MAAREKLIVGVDGPDGITYLLSSIEHAAGYREGDRSEIVLRKITPRANRGRLIRGSAAIAGVLALFVVTVHDGCGPGLVAAIFGGGFAAAVVAIVVPHLDDVVLFALDGRVLRAGELRIGELARLDLVGSDLVLATSDGGEQRIALGSPQDASTLRDALASQLGTLSPPATRVMTQGSRPK